MFLVETALFLVETARPGAAGRPLPDSASLFAVRGLTAAPGSSVVGSWSFTDWLPVAEATESHIHGGPLPHIEQPIFSPAYPAGRRHSRWLLKIPSWHLKANTHCVFSL